MPPSTLLFVVIVDGLFTDPPNMSENIPENIGAPDRMKLGTLMSLFVRYNFQSAEMGQPCHGMGLAFPAIFLRCARMPLRITLTRPPVRSGGSACDSGTGRRRMRWIRRVSPAGSGRWARPWARFSRSPRRGADKRRRAEPHVVEVLVELLDEAIDDRFRVGGQ